MRHDSIFTWVTHDGFGEWLYTIPAHYTTIVDNTIVENVHRPRISCLVTFKRS